MMDRDNILQSSCSAMEVLVEEGVVGASNEMAQPMSKVYSELVLATRRS